MYYLNRNSSRITCELDTKAGTHVCVDMKVSADPTVQNMFAFKHTPVAHRRRRRRSLLGATHAAHAGRVIIIIMASVAPGVPTAPGAKQARDHGQTHTHTHTYGVGTVLCKSRQHGELYAVHATVAPRRLGYFKAGAPYYTNYYTLYRRARTRGACPMMPCVHDTHTPPGSSKGHGLCALAVVCAGGRDR